MLNKLFNSINEKYENIKKENTLLNNLTETTDTLKNLFPITNLAPEATEYRISFITQESPDINEEKATIISKLIPINETILKSYYLKEIKTNIEYYIIPTDKYLWVINTKNYGIFQYQNLKIKIIKNNIMSKIILFNNILLEINGNNATIETLTNIINNPNFRETIIKERTNYLCGIIPIYQKINATLSGISIDQQNNIVFHSKYNNYKYNINEIDNYEVLLDNQVYSSKKYNSSKTIGTFQKECYQISLRITTKNDEKIIIPILEQNGTKYSIHDSILNKNLNFAISLIDKLNELMPKY